jgi:hypothetical protein
MRCSVVLAVVAALAAAVVLGGCNRPARMAVPITGMEIDPAFGPTVEVTNFRGSVRVVADARVKEAEVRSRIRSLERRSDLNRAELAEKVQIRAESGVENGRRMLRVVSTPTDGGEDVAVDLEIRVARTEGVRVHNTGGPVELVRIAGPVSVVNGVGGMAGGDVTVRTGAAMTEPVSLTTTSGNVLFQAGPGSSGVFDVRSDSGDAQFYSKIGMVTGSRPEPGRYRGVLNRGDNPISLHTGDGMARVVVIQNADTYGPDLWDGTPRWPQYPKPLGRLGGWHNEEPLFRRQQQQQRSAE